MQDEYQHIEQQTAMTTTIMGKVLVIMGREGMGDSNNNGQSGLIMDLKRKRGGFVLTIIISLFIVSLCYNVLC